MQPTTTKALFLATAFFFGLGTAHAVDRTTSAEEVADFDETLGEASTGFRTRGRYLGRAINVELAAKRLDGMVIAPARSSPSTRSSASAASSVASATRPCSPTVSFVVASAAVSARSPAPSRRVASRAGLEVVDHRTHSMPSSYLDPGLDARIAWGTQDYRVRNPHAFPVRLRVEAVDGRLEVAVEGAEARHYEVRTEVVRELAAAERVVVDETLAPGEEVVEHEGRDGVVVRVVRVDPEGHETVTLHRYAAAARVVRRAA
ncbi:MAG: VanW family protein [Sandaracinus sp.]|nr:VanW family protein [Sandaracinus sp.]